MGAGADGSADDGIAFGFRQKSLEIYRYGMDDCTCDRLPFGVRHAGACREDGGARTGRNPNLPKPGFSSFYPYDFLWRLFGNHNGAMELRVYGEGRRPRKGDRA